MNWMILSKVGVEAIVEKVEAEAAEKVEVEAEVEVGVEAEAEAEEKVVIHHFLYNLLIHLILQHHLHHPHQQVIWKIMV